jgi:hypothetical protein
VRVSPEAKVDQLAVPLPGTRWLRTFAFDPMSTRLSGRHLRVEVPFEPLAPGPMGRSVHVVDYDDSRRTWYQPVDLDLGVVLAQEGLRPSENDPRSHQQVVYAVATSVIDRFERFMGRRFRWRQDQVLRLVPHAFEGRNAYFDPRRQAVLFGYYAADLDDPGANLPGQVIFTCLSNDIIAHEVTHAIVHRLRRRYADATNPDVFALHEAIADLVALFHHFNYPEVVREAIASTSGDLRSGGGLLDLAREFGESTGRGAALRSALRQEKQGEKPVPFSALREPHERGAAFVVAVFRAFLDAYQHAIADLLRIATGGSGVLPAGALHPDLVDRVTTEAIHTADRMLRMVVRAFDYLPVVDPTFGDLVRGIVTADRELYPEDGAHLRGRLVESLRVSGIYPSGVGSLAGDALTWPVPDKEIRLNDEGSDVDVPGILASAAQDLDIGADAGDMGASSFETWLSPQQAPGEVSEQGQKLGQAISEWANRHALDLGLDPQSIITLAGLHVSFRIGEDQQPRPEIVLQLAQRRADLEDQSLDPDRRPRMRAGTTVILRADGVVARIIPKPLPLKDDSLLNGLPAHDAARRFDAWGADRLAALRAWQAKLTDVDPLSAWTAEPAQWRLNFAALHSEPAGVLDVDA